MTDTPPACEFGARRQGTAPEWFTYNQVIIPPPFNNVTGWIPFTVLGLPGNPQNTSDFCSSYTPGPLPSTADWANGLIPVLGAATGAYSRIANYWKQTAYAAYCECAPPAGPGCSTRSFAITWDIRSPQGSRCGPASYYVDGSTGNLNFPPGQHHVRITTPGFTPTHDLQVDVYTSSLAEQCTPWLAGTELNIGFNGNASDTFVGIAFRDAGANPLWLLDQELTLEFSNLVSEPPCAGSGTPVPVGTPENPPSGVPAPPAASCATTSDVCTAIAQLERDVSYLILQSQLLSSREIPLDYMDGTEYPNLTGAGEIPISRLLGMRVYVVTPPPDQPVLPGNPPYLWNCGWMAVANPDGVIEERRVVRSGMTWLPRQMQLATSFQYALTPGTVVTAIEIRPPQV